jgi:hypothetical protein
MGLRRPGGRARLLCAGVALALAPAVSARDIAASDLPRAAVSDVPSAGVLRARVELREADGAPIARVFYDLRGGTGERARDAELRARIEREAGLREGDSLRSADLRALPDRLRRIEGIGDASVGTWFAGAAGRVVVVVSAVLVPEPATAPAAAPLPTIHGSDTALLRLQLAGGFGLYNDHNPWFAAPATFTGRSPIAEDAPGAGWTSWAENFVEYGLAGAVRLGEARATAFAEATGLVSSATGSDLFRSDTRTRHAVEKAYAGFAWTDRAAGRSIRFSGGRQNWQLYNGFLFSRFAAGSNAGPSPGLYLSPRTTYQRALLLDARWGGWRAEAFDVDPTEVEAFDSGTRYVGYNLRTGASGKWEAGYTRYRVPESRANVGLAGGGSVPRQGLRTQALRAGWQGVGGIEGLDLLGEYAEQDHRDVDWNATAWYAQASWAFKDVPWQPNVTYRRAVFSGDDASTPAQEAFDAQLSSGLDEWVQGVSFKKVVTNSNLATHRLRFNAGPRPERNYTLDFFRLEADQPTASGATHYGDEVNLALRWAVTPRIFILGVGGVAWPGEVIDERTGGKARPWGTVQASVFWGF